MQSTQTPLVVEAEPVIQPHSLFDYFVTPQSLHMTMMLLQLMWLASIWLSGASTNWLRLTIIAVYTIVVGITISLLPARFWHKVSQFKHNLVEHDKNLLLTLCIFTLCVGVIYAHYQRLWPYDEENSFKAATILATQGVGAFFAQYAKIDWLGRWHPPLTPVLYGFALRLLGTNLLVMRLVTLVLAVATTIITYLIGRQLYDRETGLIGAFFLLSFPLFLRQGTVAMTDIPVTFFFALTMLLVFYLVQKPTYWLAVGAGLCLGAGFLTKYTMVFIGPVLLSYLAVNAQFRRAILYLMVVGLVAGIVMAGWLFYASQLNVLSHQQTNIVTEFEPAYFLVTLDGIKWLIDSILTKFTSALGVYNLPLIAVGFLALVQRRRQADLLILLWTTVVSIILVFTLPDHRYFMPTFPAIALILAHGLKKLPSITESTVVLALLYCGGALYLFVDWFRVADLFTH